jgi:DNA-binding CsgD family transcriptional regulator
MVNSEFQERLDAVFECEAEPSEEVWARLASGGTFDELSGDLGYSPRYVHRLVAEALERRILAGVRYSALKKVIGESELQCWSILLSLSPGTNRFYHAGAAAAALRGQVLELHRSGASVERISQQLRLSLPTVRRLRILAMLDETTTYRIEKLFSSPNKRTTGYRWDVRGKTTKHQDGKVAPKAAARRSQKSPTPLNAQDAARLRRNCLRLHMQGRSLEEIQVLLTLNERTSRTLLAVALVESGWTLEAAGSYVGLSRERVRQVARASGLNVRALKASRRRADEQVSSQLQTLIRDWIRSHPGCRLDEVAAALHLASLEKRDVPRDVVHLVLGTPSAKMRVSVQVSKDSIISALRDAFEIRNPLSSMYSEEARLPVSGPFYDKLRRSGRVKGPSEVRIIQVFGSWSAACELAGVPSPPPIRAEYSRRWTDEELVEHLAAFLLQATLTDINKFDLWCREDAARPSSGTVRNQLRLSWSEAKRAALSALRARWTEAPVV